MKSTRKTGKEAPGLQKVNSDKKSTLSQRSKSTLVNGLVNDDVAVMSADDMAVMMSPRADVSKRNLARDSAWMRMTVCGGT